MLFRLRSLVSVCCLNNNYRSFIFQWIAIMVTIISESSIGCSGEMLNKANVEVKRNVEKTYRYLFIYFSEWGKMHFQLSIWHCVWPSIAYVDVFTFLDTFLYSSYVIKIYFFLYPCNLSFSCYIYTLFLTVFLDVSNPLKTQFSTEFPISWKSV